MENKAVKPSNNQMPTTVEFILANVGEARTKALNDMDSMLIRGCITIYGNNQTKIAEVLGLNRGTLRKRMIELGFEMPRS